MKCVLFCFRHGAWLNFGNVDLHLIKGPPCVHSDDDLIVSHIALVVADMPALRQRLTDMGVKSRKNISVPNPELNQAVDQVRTMNQCIIKASNRKKVFINIYWTKSSNKPK